MPPMRSPPRCASSIWIFPRLLHGQYLQLKPNGLALLVKTELKRLACTHQKALDMGQVALTGHVTASMGLHSSAFRSSINPVASLKAMDPLLCYEHPSREQTQSETFQFAAKVTDHCIELESSAPVASSARNE